MDHFHDDSSFLGKTTFVWSTAPYLSHRNSSDQLCNESILQKPIKIANCRFLNCPIIYGPNISWKMIPLCIHNIKNNRPTSSLWKGRWKRRWLGFLVKITLGNWTLFHTGKSGETYNIGGSTEWKGYLISFGCFVRKWIQTTGRRAAGTSEKLTTYVDWSSWTTDRSLAMNATKSERNGMGTKSPIRNEELSLPLICTWKNPRIGWIMAPLCVQEYYSELYGRIRFKKHLSHPVKIIKNPNASELIKSVKNLIL